MKFTKTMAAVAGVGLVAAGLLSASPASADPSGNPAGNTRVLQGVGSDTTMNVMDDMSNAIQVNGQLAIASWTAAPGTATFTTRSNNAACTYTRTEANGSGAGRSRLVESLTAGNSRFGCLDFARSSSGKGTFTSTPSVTFVPFAKDGFVTITRADGGVPRSLAMADIQGIFKCQPAYAGIWPVLPQTGSGTRAYWVTTVLGITEANISAGTYPCLVPVGTTVNGIAGTGRPYVQEHNGTALKVDEIEPFSTGLFNVQANGLNADTRGFSSVLDIIDGAQPVITNAADFQTTPPLVRNLYNIIPTANTGTAPWSTVFVGTSSSICTNTTIIKNNGFIPLTAADPKPCGDITDAS